MDMKETKELVAAIIDLIKLLKSHIEDGITIADAAIIYELINDPIYRKAVLGLKLIPEELKDMTADEALDLVQFAIEEIRA